MVTLLTTFPPSRDRLGCLVRLGSLQCLLWSGLQDTEQGVWDPAVLRPSPGDRMFWNVLECFLNVLWYSRMFLNVLWNSFLHHCSSWNGIIPVWWWHYHYYWFDNNDINDNDSDDIITTIDIMIVISLSLYNDRRWSTASLCACTGLRTRWGGNTKQWSPCPDSRMFYYWHRDSAFSCVFK